MLSVTYGLTQEYQVSFGTLTVPDISSFAPLTALLNNSPSKNFEQYYAHLYVSPRLHDISEMSSLKSLDMVSMATLTG